MNVEHTKLSAEKNPNRSIEYISELAKKIYINGINTVICLQYIPDGLIVGKSDFSEYLESFGDSKETLEEIARIILDDINNEIIPFWVNISLVSKNDGLVHAVTLEDRQPDWKNDDLLSRLEKI